MKLILTALAAASLAAAVAPAAALAQDRHDFRQDRREVREDRHEVRQDRQGGRHWRQGDRLDRRYGSYTVVSDWRSRRLPPPRRGYHWVRSGDDYVLAALTGGLIASVIAASN
jgi:Ni/Co efflux regulator RcnB